MTIGKKLHQTLATLQSTAGDMKSFALQTQDKNAKQMYAVFAEQLENMVQGFEGRVNYIESQEPQFQVMDQAQQQQ